MTQMLQLATKPPLPAVSEEWANEEDDVESAETASPVLLPPRRAIKQEVLPPSPPITTAQAAAQVE